MINTYESPVFSIAGEIAKGVVRELFFIRTQFIDGACAALLHLTQSEKVRDYYKHRHLRLSNPASQKTHDIYECRAHKDKFLQVTLD